MTKFEKQKAQYEVQSIYFDQAFPNPALSDEEHLALRGLIVYICNQHDPSMPASVSPTMIFYDICRLHGHLDLKKHTAEFKKVFPYPEILDQALAKLQLLVDFYDHKQFIIDDGGETREDDAFEEDGNTIKDGWLNFYYK